MTKRVRDRAGGYPVEDGVALIEIRLQRIEQLFSSFDPSPFREKDLDPAAEQYIVDAADDFPLAAPLRLVVYLPAEQVALAGGEGVRAAIHTYFGWRLAEQGRRLRFARREGRISLAIGLAFLFGCIFLRELVREAVPPGTGREILAEGLLISGWVALWRPIDILLHGWWPHRHARRLYAKLAALPVELRTRLPGAEEPPPRA